jgi:hypothetical protein
VASVTPWPLYAPERDLLPLIQVTYVLSHTSPSLSTGHDVLGVEPVISSESSLCTAPTTKNKTELSHIIRVQFILLTRHACISAKYTVELGYDVVKGTEYFVSS